MFLIIIAVNLILFHRTLKYMYANDDFEVVRCSCKEPNFKDVPGPRGVKRICINCRMQKGDIPKSRAQNVWWHVLGHQYTNSRLAHSLVMIIHTANCLLIYLAFGRTPASLLAAILFAVHPLATQGSSVWLSGKHYGMCLTLVLLMWWLPGVSPIFYYLTLPLNVAAITAPLLFSRTPWWPIIPLLAIIVIARRKIVWSHGKSKFDAISRMRPPFEPVNIILMFKTIGFYLILCILPTTLGVHHPYLETYGLTPEDSKKWLKLDRFFYLGLVCVFSFIVAFFFWWNPITFGMMWFLIFILPWSNLITTHQFIAERYATLALAGYCYFLSNLILIIPIKEIQYAVCAVFLTYYTTRTAFYLPFYANVMETAQWNVMNFKTSFSAWAWKGGIERNLGLHERAFESWVNAWAIRPNDFRINNNLATMSAAKGDFNEAKKFFNMAVTSPVPKHKEEDKQKQLAFLKSEIIQKEALLKRHVSQISRNEPCPCNSGRKFKHCCGKDQVWRRE